MSVPDHIQTPHLRPIQPLPMMKDGKPFVALRDPAMLVDQTIVVPAQVLQVLQQFRGERTIEQLAEQFHGDAAQLADLASRLDQIGLLWGPTFERLENELKERLEDEGAFPPAATKSLGEDEQACRDAINDYLEQTDDPELEAPPIGIVAPHLDYERGWPNYAAAYYALGDLEPPDRVVILGTNHFGVGDGVVSTQYGFTSPMGQVRTDEAVIGALVARLGKPLIIDQLDHIAEHSIELQLPWLQHAFGDVSVVAALVPDPLVGLIEDDGERVDAQQFIAALREALDEVGGRTFFVASSDLSHVGPQFGEPRAVDERRRFDVERHDRDMLAKFLTGDAEEFLGAMKWNRNPTRWCSIGNMTALLALAQPNELELLDYRQAYDGRGQAMVSSAAIALL